MVYPPGIASIVPGERFDERARPMLDYLKMFESSANLFPGFEVEIRETEKDGTVRFYTYVVREWLPPVTETQNAWSYGCLPLTFILMASSGGVASPGPSARCIRILSVQRPYLKPTDFKRPACSNPNIWCRRCDGMLATSI